MSDRVKNTLVSFFFGGFGIDRMINGCWVSGFAKGLLPLTLIGIPPAGMWWMTDVGYSAIGRPLIGCSTKNKTTTANSKKGGKRNKTRKR